MNYKCAQCNQTFTDEESELRTVTCTNCHANLSVKDMDFNNLSSRDVLVVSLPIIAILISIVIALINLSFEIHSLLNYSLFIIFPLVLPVYKRIALMNTEIHKDESI